MQHIVLTIKGLKLICNQSNRLRHINHNLPFLLWALLSLDIAIYVTYVDVLIGTGSSAWYLLRLLVFCCTISTQFLRYSLASLYKLLRFFRYLPPLISTVATPSTLTSTTPFNSHNCHSSPPFYLLSF